MYDDPATVNQFLNAMQDRFSAGKANSRPPSTNSALTPETAVSVPLCRLQVLRFALLTPAKQFSPRDLAGDCKLAGPKFENAAPQHVSQQENAAPNWQSGSQSPFPKVTPSSKAGPLDLIQDENGFVAEAPAPVTVTQDPALTPQNPNASRQYRGSLTPTQYKLLSRKEPDFGKLTTGKLSELEKMTENYMDNVVENFRKSHQPVAAQDQVNLDETNSEAGSMEFPEMDETPINAEILKPNVFSAETRKHDSSLILLCSANWMIQLSSKNGESKMNRQSPSTPRSRPSEVSKVSSRLIPSLNDADN